MSASKFTLYGIATALFGSPRTLSANPPILFSKPFPLKPTRFQRCSSFAVVDTITAENGENLSCVDPHQHHPWPEWVSFVDRLKTQGYLTESSPPPSSAVDIGVATDADGVYKNMNLVKDACLSFARDRYDVFKLLSVKDIQRVVENGCPNLLRKPVNSAKRLRAYVRLDEGDVCGVCNLRGSCDRAYVIIKDFEAAARTVDILRILMFYALDPLVILGGQKPPGREVIESSARKLLSELIELTESSSAPPRLKPTAQDARPKDQLLNPVNDILSKDVEMKRGDWMCPKCNFLNFARNIRCLNCNEDGPKSIGQPDVEMKKGDWICPKCSFMNFSRNIHCLKCKAEGPKRVSTEEVEKKNGDWDCPRCGFMNFSSNRRCLRCPEPRPMQRPGDWYCPKCDFMNYSRNTVCLKCNTKHPKEEPTPKEEDHIWRRPN